MRILHTSDWHLGRLFHRASLLDTQAVALDRIIDLVGDADIDVVVIAGDLYDRAIPPADAVDLFDSALLRIRDAGAKVVAISGNHDSPSRVGYADRLLARVGVTVRGDTARAADPVEIGADDGGRPLVIYPIPYLDPLAVSHRVRNERDADGGSDGHDEAEGVDGSGLIVHRRFTHQDAIDWALGRARADLADRDVRSLVVAHTFVDGATVSESEREISVGTIDRVAVDSFEGFDYVALGHLHKSQAWLDDRVAYSGTPLPYSFSEEDHVKSVRIIDLAGDGTPAVEVVPLGVGRPLQTITGQLEELLADPGLTDAEEAWVRVFLTDPVLPLQAMNRLQRRFPHAVELRHEPAGSDGDRPGAGPSRDDLREMSPLDLSLQFLADQRESPVTPPEHELLAAAISAVQTGERA